MASDKYTKSYADWNPGPGKKASDKADQLMATEASDAKDTMTGTNELKQWVGGSGKPPGPYGVAAKKF
jgi:hypothetical protein